MEERLERTLPTVQLSGGLETVLIDTMVQGKARSQLEAALPDYLKIQRWFGAKERGMEVARLMDAVRLQSGIYLALVRVEFADGGIGRYFLPLTSVSAADAPKLIENHPRAALAWLTESTGRTLLYDATADENFWLALYQAARREWRGRSLKGLYSAKAVKGIALPEVDDASEVHVLGVEQSNSSATFDEAVFAKLYRRFGEETNPEAEMLTYLTQAGFPFVPQIRGDVRFKRGELELTLGIFQTYLPGGQRYLELCPGRGQTLFRPRRGEPHLLLTRCLKVSTTRFQCG